MKMYGSQELAFTSASSVATINPERDAASGLGLVRCTSLPQELHLVVSRSICFVVHEIPAYCDRHLFLGSTVASLSMPINRDQTLPGEPQHLLQGTSPKLQIQMIAPRNTIAEWLLTAMPTSQCRRDDDTML
jgi:hypothetical protein